MIIDRLVQNVTKELENDVVHITFFFGAATYPLDGEPFEEIYNQAQTQLYKNRNLRMIE